MPDTAQDEAAIQRIINTYSQYASKGDWGRATSGIRESGKTAGKDEAFDYFGIYADTFTRTGGGWKFRTRLFEGIGSQTYVLLTSAAH